MTMRWDQKSFGIGTATTDAYRDSWDRIFGKKPPCTSEGCDKAQHRDDCALCLEHCKFDH